MNTKQNDPRMNCSPLVKLYIKFKTSPNNKNSNQQRPTIGYMTSGIRIFSLDTWAGIVDMARQQDVNLLCFLGWNLHDPRGFQAQANIIYELVTPENVDGLISWASVIGAYVTLEQIEAFHRRYDPLPTVTIGRTIAQGPGIPPEIMPHIFEPLYSTKSFGVGLGLPVVAGIVKQHGGKIEVNSEPGTGTQVIVWLPVAASNGEIL